VNACLNQAMTLQTIYRTPPKIICTKLVKFCDF